MGNKLPFSNHNSEESPFDEEEKENKLYHCKVLLLGTGDSGKSTLFFQYHLLREPDKLLIDSYVPVIHQNVYEILKDIVENCIKKNSESPLENEKNYQLYKEVYGKKRDSMVVKQTSILNTEDFDKMHQISKDKNVENMISVESSVSTQKNR